jgi:hypothetical protein
VKMLADPRMIEPRQGGSWLAAGFRLFHQQPLAWTLILFIYWASMLMLAFIPVLGMIVPLLLTPGLALGFIEVARAVDEKRPPSPPLLISAFRSPQAKAVLTLGSLYLLEVVVILLATMLVDGGLLIEWIAKGAVPPAEDMGSVRTAGLLGMLLYVPVMMAFWFAPQLVVWSGFTPVKALFFSFFAVWRNRGAFLRYLITWIGLTVFLGAVFALLSMVLEMTPGTLNALIFPVTLILMAVAHSSFYVTTKAIFGDTVAGPL